MKCLCSLQQKKIYSLVSSVCKNNSRIFSSTSISAYPASDSNVDTPGKSSPPASTKEGDGFLKRKYSDTLLLPKTDFPMKISYVKRNEHEIEIANKFQFEQLYGFQRLWRQEQPEFILHDGPPYANGDVHIGHAVNKILKDITNRYKLLRGYKINYIPGWDCHGLPIELKAVRDGKHGVLTDPIKIRDAARKVVDQSIASHIEAFKRWGVMAEWNSPYKTLDKNCVKTQLQSFYELHEKGLVYRDLKPVFWSPSSRTALAEAELEYYQYHESPSAYVAVDLNSDVQEFLSKIEQISHALTDGKIQAIIWTTTPWTLPANKAIAFHQSEKYSLLDARQSHSKDENSYYIVASSLLDQFFIDKNQKYNVLLEFSGENLTKFKYKHPWFEAELCPFVHGDHVTMEKGTGLVHLAPAHGHDDYVLGLKHKLKMDCYVDNDGKFDTSIPNLRGMDVLSSGNDAVLKHLGSKVINFSKLKHSYPYDWRTKKPVIVKTSMQWFINTEELKSKALEQLNHVNIYPSNVQNGMLAQLIRRPYWCISRQRVWGVPIPVLYHKETGKPLIEKAVIDRMCELVDVSGNVDSWWDIPVSSLLPDDSRSEDYEKGKDIFDIWYDSGITWNLFGNKVTDLYLEGKDQFQGWFQSSLLLSVGLRGYSPYKNLYVHGFVVDDDGRKMSKSVGNVVNPLEVVKGGKEKDKLAYGADVLRWWVAAQGSADGGNISVSSSLLRSSDESVQKLRNVLKFLISFCNEASAAELDLEHITYDELMYTDQYMLSLLSDFRQQVTGHYDEYNYHRVLMKTLHFATTEVSAQYFTWVKDRLYCDFKQSQSRKSCIYVLNQIYLTFAKVLAPVLPFLVEESYYHYKLGNQSIFKSLWFEDEVKTWENSHISSTFELVLDVRESLNHVIGSNNPKDIWVELQCNSKNYKILQILHSVLEDEADKCDSELCDILQVSGVDLQCYDEDEKNRLEPEKQDDPLRTIKFSIEPVGVGHSLTGFSVGICKTEMMQCARCRRFCCTPGDVLCSRCLSVMKGLLQKKSQEQIIIAQSDTSKRKFESKQ